MTCLAIALIGCDRPAQSVDGAAPATDDGYIGAEPHLSRADDGTVVLSWLQPDGDATALRFVTRRNGQWSAPRTVVSGTDWFVNWADFPSVTPIRNDLWAAHWLVKRPGGTYAYDVAVALSSDSGDSWTAPITPHTDDTRTEHGFVTLFPWQDHIGAVWLDGREMAADHTAHGGGMTLRSAQLTAAGDILGGQLVDELVCDCCQTDVAVTPDGPIAAYRNRTADEIRDIYVARYVDENGWQPGAAVADDGWHISGCPVNGPAIVAKGNDVAVAWFTAANDMPRVRVARSNDGGKRFAEAVDVDIDRPAGRVDIEMLDGDRLVVSYLGRSANGGGEIAVQSIDGDGEPGARRVVARTGASRSAGFPQMIRQGDELVFAWTQASGDTHRVLTAALSVREFR